MNVTETFKKIQEQLPIPEDQEPDFKFIGLNQNEFSENGILSLTHTKQGYNHSWSNIIEKNKSMLENISEKKVDKFIEFCQSRDLNWRDISLSATMHPNKSNPVGSWDNLSYEKSINGYNLLKAIELVSSPDFSNKMESFDPNMYSQNGEAIIFNLLLKAELKRYKKLEVEQKPYLSKADFMFDYSFDTIKNHFGNKTIKAIQYLNENHSDIQGNTLYHKLLNTGEHKFKSFYKKSIQTKGDIFEDGEINGVFIKASIDDEFEKYIRDNDLSDYPLDEKLLAYYEEEIEEQEIANNVQKATLEEPITIPIQIDISNEKSLKEALNRDYLETEIYYSTGTRRFTVPTVEEVVKKDLFHSLNKSNKNDFKLKNQSTARRKP